MDARLGRTNVLSIALCLLLLAGCANPGTPRPPSLHLPALVTDLAAERRGTEVVLTWTTPDRTTDGLKISGPVTAIICRQTVLAPDRGARCTSFLEAVVKPGPSRAVDRLPDGLDGGSPALLTYRVELRNGQARTAGASQPAYAASGDAPPPLTGLTARSTSQGVLLAWRPQASLYTVLITRTVVGGNETAEGQRGLSAGSQTAEVHLRGSPTRTGTVFGSDAGGTMDATASANRTYEYRAERQATLHLSGHVLEVHSAPSPAVRLDVVDVFPPRPPEGLAAVVTAFQNAETVDLSWMPNTEPDLAGYLVFRQDQAALHTPEPMQLTLKPVGAPAFRDTSARPDMRYTYTVIAIDSAGNRSHPSAPAIAEPLSH